MFLWMHFHAWQTKKRRGELVAKGNLKTDSASNSNDDKHVSIKAGAGARVE